VLDCTFSCGFATGGSGGDGGQGEASSDNYGGVHYSQPGGNGGLGGIGAGGAICLLSGEMALTNSTIFSNGASGGVVGTGGTGEQAENQIGAPAGAGGNGANGGDALGGGLCLLAGRITAVHITCADNTVAPGAPGTGGPVGTGSIYFPGGPPGTNGSPGSAQGDTIAITNGSFTLLNSILSCEIDRTNIHGAIVDSGYNLSSDATTTLTNVRSSNHIDPGLGSPGNYGGPTPTIALLSSSPAIDGADPTSFPSTDQRGRPRPYGARPDIGAFEFSPPSLQVTIVPQGAISAGARWQIDNGPWQESGTALSDLSAEGHALSFSAISNWITPATQTLLLTSNSFAAATGAYSAVQKGRPILAISSPRPGQSVSNALLLVTGTATGGLSAPDVYYQLDEGAWTIAMPGFSASDWVASVTPSPGLNTISVYAQDADGTSPTNTVAFKFIPSATLVVQTQGNGRVTPDANGQLLAINAKYTLVASAAKNWFFSNWVGGSSQPYNVLTTNASYSFQMASNLVLQANFMTNMLSAVQGNYYSLFAPSNTPRQNTNSGGVNFSVTSSGTCSGTILIGPDTLKFSGKFNSDGAARIVTIRKGRNNLTTTLQLDFDSQTVTGEVTDGFFVAQVWGYLDAFNSHNTASAYEGAYTLVIPGVTNPAIGPYGTSCGTVTVSSLGRITFVGSLADGTPVSQSSVVSPNGLWPLYLPLRGGSESLWGWNSCLVDGDDITAIRSWQRLPVVSC
jgi:hypothetical protein